jgi:hypothetical protein
MKLVNSNGIGCVENTTLDYSIWLRGNDPAQLYDFNLFSDSKQVILFVEESFRNIFWNQTSTDLLC